MTQSDIPAHIARGQAMRKKLLAQTLRVATIEGLESLTIGRMASAIGLSKAGLLGHFPSKEHLQLATLDAAKEEFLTAVILPSQDAPAGLPRLVALIDRWLDHVTASEGGCFFASVSAEFDCRPGPIKEAIAQMVKEWQQMLKHAIRESQGHGHITDTIAAETLVFGLHAYELALNVNLQLLSDKRAPALARQGIYDLLAANTNPSARHFLRPLAPKASPKTA